MKAIFIKCKRNYKEVKSRQGFLCEVQICIKNLNVIHGIKEYNFSSKVSKYEGIWNGLLNIEPFYRERPTKNNWYKMHKNGYKS